MSLRACAIDVWLCAADGLCRPLRTRRGRNMCARRSVTRLSSRDKCPPGCRGFDWPFPCSCSGCCCCCCCCFADVSPCAALSPSPASWCSCFLSLAAVNASKHCSGGRASVERAHDANAQGREAFCGSNHQPKPDQQHGTNHNGLEVTVRSDGEPDCFVVLLYRNPDHFLQRRHRSPCLAPTSVFGRSEQTFVRPQTHAHTQMLLHTYTPMHTHMHAHTFPLFFPFGKEAHKLRR